MRPSEPRPLTAGPDEGPQDPFPLRLNGKVIKGFGRGSKELGIPTANIPIEGLSVGGHTDVDSGVYFGWAGLDVDGQARKKVEGGGGGGEVFAMVMSIGWNPYYKNTVRSVEVHIMHAFPADFYGAHMNLLILGFIRPELDYVSKELLIEDIKFDIQVAERSLKRKEYDRWKEDAYLKEFGERGDVAS